MKIISGGQTGVDRAALDAAIANHFSHGGWCPKGRRAELDTVIPLLYNLTETPSEDYETRTKWNVRDSNATLIFVPTNALNLSGGTQFTLEQAQSQKKPYLIIDCSQTVDADTIVSWIHINHIDTLNVAGPRESQAPGIYGTVFEILATVLSKLSNV